MDPIKKTFAEAFNDFELPVREDLWERVLEKKQPKKKNLFPFLRVAAAIALLLVSGAIYWQISRIPIANGGPELTQVPAEDEIKQLGIEEKFLPPTKTEASDKTIIHVRDGLVISPKKISKIAAKPYTNSSPPPENVVITVQETQTPLEMTVHTEALINSMAEEISALNNPSLDLVHTVQPQEVIITEATIPATLSKRNSEQLIAKVKPALSDRSKTGPQRFLAALESLKPKVVDDLIAFGSRNTEIEINW
ncbi:MAG: hypothetical protein KA479_08025 [Saprospiraceae bacterium]|nr:hypothetical protein [Saprospiraceae bacterium]